MIAPNLISGLYSSQMGLFHFKGPNEYGLLGILYSLIVVKFRVHSHQCTSYSEAINVWPKQVEMKWMLLFCSKWNKQVECWHFAQSVCFEPKVFLMSMMAVWSFIIFQQSKNAFWSISFLTKIKVIQNNTHTCTYLDQPSHLKTKLKVEASYWFCCPKLRPCGHVCTKVPVTMALDPR